MSQNSSVSCDACVAACCRAGSSIMLSDTERQRHRRRMNLQTLVKLRPYRQTVEVTNNQVDDGSAQIRAVPGTLSVPAHRGFYVFLSDCQYLQRPADDENGENKTCSIYESRPEACKNYEVGSSACLAARAKFGLDGHQGTEPLNRDEPLVIRNWQQLN